MADEANKLTDEAVSQSGNGDGKPVGDVAGKTDGDGKKTDAVSKRDCWVGFDLGGTKMLATVFDSSFKQLGSKRKKTRGHEGAKAGLQRIAQTIHGAMADAEISVERLRGIGVGCPGPLDLDRGVILEAPNLGWENVAIRASLEKEFGCSAVIANDVDSGVYGEYRFGAGKSARCVLGVFPGTGVGGGCVYDGRIIRGRTTSCMEIGFTHMMPGGPTCGAGMEGCLEGVASRMAIAAAAAQAAYRGHAPHLYSIAGTDVSKIRSGALAESIEEGDTAIEEIVLQAARYLGIAVANVVHLLAPDVVVLGGGLVEAMPKLIRDAVRESAREHVLPSFEDMFEVKVAKLGDDAAVMGAAAWAEEVIRSKKKS